MAQELRTAFPGTTIIIELGQSVPGTRVLSSLDHDNMDFAFSAESTQSFSYDMVVVLALAVVGMVRLKAGAKVSIPFLFELPCKYVILSNQQNYF
jgi:hypothetical protein